MNAPFSPDHRGSLPPSPPAPSPTPAEPIPRSSKDRPFHLAARFAGFVVLAMVVWPWLSGLGGGSPTDTPTTPAPGGGMHVRNNMSTVDQADQLGCPVLLALRDEMRATGEWEINPAVWDELSVRIDGKGCDPDG